MAEKLTQKAVEALKKEVKQLPYASIPIVGMPIAIYRDIKDKIAENQAKAELNQMMEMARLEKTFLNNDTLYSLGIESVNLTKNDFQEFKKEILLASNVGKIQSEITKSYLPLISQKYRPVSPSRKLFSYINRVRVLQVEKWVIDKEEKLLDKLGNVYSALSNVNCSVTLVYRRTKEGTKAYFVITNQSDKIDPAVVDSYFMLFVSALKGNFPGVEIREIEEIGTYENTSPDSLIGEWFSDANSNAIAMVTNIASESSEDFISQGIEKLLDGVVPKDDDTEYTIMLVAEPMNSTDLNGLKMDYEKKYTELSPFETVQLNMSLSEAISSTTNVSRNTSVSQGGNRGINLILYNRSRNSSSTVSSSSSRSDGKTETYGETFTATKTNYGVKETLQKIESHIERIQQGEALGMWKFATYILADTFSVAQSVANMYRSLTEGEESFAESSAINMWNDNRYESKEEIDIIQSYLKAFKHPQFMLRGLEQITYDEEPDKNKSIQKYIESENAVDFLTMPDTVFGYTNIVSKELSMSMNMPGSAVSGLPVIECASFGRDVISQSFNYGNNQVINLGNIFHMQQEERTPVLLDANCMTEHTFITGSTGAGKSTTIYRILSEATKLKTNEDKDVTFLVVEPAKGEYKNEISRLTDKDVYLYGTNPMSTEGELLRINPFSFPANKIHILEHLDKLIEIFNVCWPMYAAMPAVLKNGIEKAYEACGWDLMESRNRIRSNLFPTFADVCYHIRDVINKSDYSAESKGDYKGALVTRLESLTNGINGLIFSADEIPDSVIFEQNAIVDLSRVGSIETKALIMGLLVMKLQEYRMSTAGMPNAELKHITVLEEAHNLLKRTSTEQSAEGSNLLGKSVEMLSNSIAEMRTYGEAFIIADQAPGLLDMSVIRNTNTKIIMRLPDYSDRELVGRAANLDDEQIVEIAKLRPGVAAVYYNGWINPVLCKVPRSISEDAFSPANHSKKRNLRKDYTSTIVDIVIKKQKIENIEKVITELIESGCPGELISMMIEFFKTGDQNLRTKLTHKIVYLMFDPSKELNEMTNAKNVETTSAVLKEKLKLFNFNLTPRMNDAIVYYLILEHSRRTSGFTDLCDKYRECFKNKYDKKE